MPSKLLLRTTSRHPALSPEEATRLQLDKARWLAQRKEDILEPDLPIIDAHHHLWVRPGNRYLLDDYLRDVRSGHNIRASVFVECGAFYRKGVPPELASVGEVEFANGIAAMAASGGFGDTLVCAGIVGTADISIGADVGGILDALIAAGGGRFRGIRVTTKWDADDELNNTRYAIPRGLMADPDFRAGFATLAQRELTFDAMIYHHQLPELADLARAFPETTIILNHIGGLVAHTRTYVTHQDQAVTQWRTSMTALAKCPNVYVKLGGLGMSYLGLGFDRLPAPASSETLAGAWGPLYMHCIDSFGPQRCMFESNFPPDRDSVDFPVIWNTFKRIAANCSPDEKHALFSGTAAKVYRLAL